MAEPIGQALKLLSSCVHDSTVGVAVFDKDLRCRAYNETFLSMQGGSGHSHLGKTIEQLFEEEASSLEPALQRAWSTGKATSNYPPAARSPSLPRWVVHFYPVKDATGIVHLVATTFAEVSRRNSAELQLSRLKHKLHSNLPRRTVTFDSEFSLWNARVLGLVESSIATLKSSTHVRHCSTMARMESGLGHLDFSLSFTQDGDADSKAPYDPSPAAIREVASLDPPPAPSPREREVLHHLAEGKSNKQIGSVLHLSTRTVETYRARLMLKLRIHSTAELVRYAIRHQITAA